MVLLYAYESGASDKDLGFDHFQGVAIMQITMEWF